MPHLRHIALHVCDAVGSSTYLTLSLSEHVIMQLPDSSDRRKALTLDRRKVMQMAMGDRELLERLFELFREYYPNLLQELENAVTLKDGPQITELAHRLKGSVSTFHAQGAIEAARALEVCGRNNDLTHVEARLQLLTDQIASLDQAISDWVTEMNA